MSTEKFNPHNRRRARRYALQALYQWGVSKLEIAEIENQFLHDNNMENVEVAYFQELLHEIPKQISDLNAAIEPLLDRKISELNPIELISLRIGAYELLKRIDIPYKVAINEAVELTKKFGTVEGHKYVNAVLDKLAHQVRPHG